MLRKSLVRWNDGTYDGQRECDLCKSENCKNPVYKDSYKEVITKKSYWNWIEENMEADNGGTVEFQEPTNSNPDTLRFKGWYNAAEEANEIK